MSSNPPPVLTEYTYTHRIDARKGLVHFYARPPPRLTFAVRNVLMHNECNTMEFTVPVHLGDEPYRVLDFEKYTWQPPPTDNK